MLIGTLDVNIYNEEIMNFYIDQNNQFTNQKEDLEGFAALINSPWSQADKIYTIRYNCKDAYTPKEDNEPDWVCEYKVIGYEMITSVLYGYGNTQQEALKNCMDMFDRLQKEFNKDGASI